MYELIWHGRELIRRLDGTSSSVEYERSVIEAQRDPRYDDVCDVISDFRDCVRFENDAKAMEGVAVHDSGAALSNPRIRVALVVTDPAIAAQVRQSLRNYLDLNVNHRPVTIVDSMDAARAWLRDNPAPRAR